MFKYGPWVIVAAAFIVSGCERSVTLLTPTTPNQTIVEEVLTGTVAAPVGGALQTVTRTFVVGQGGGAVSVTLTSAVQTLPDGSLQTTVIMGLGVGQLVNSVCVIPSGSFTTARSGTSPHLAGSLPEGTYCVQVSDVTTQQGPVAFAVTVSHP